MGASASTAICMHEHRLADSIAFEVFSEEPLSAFRTAVERGSVSRHYTQVFKNVCFGRSAFSFSISDDSSLRGNVADLNELHGDGGDIHDSVVAMNQSGGAGGSQNHGDGDLSLDHSGSYNDADMLNFFDKWLEPWGPGRRWEILMLDAYAPGLTDAVHQTCWQRGFIPIAHGGGATRVYQPNDTNMHARLRKHFIEKQRQH